MASLHNAYFVKDLCYFIVTILIAEVLFEQSLIRTAV